MLEVATDTFVGAVGAVWASVIVAVTCCVPLASPLLTVAMPTLKVWSPEELQNLTRRKEATP